MLKKFPLCLAAIVIVCISCTNGFQGKIEDNKIKEEIIFRFMDEPFLENIDVYCEGGCITLSGTVPREENIF